MTTNAPFQAWRRTTGNLPLTLERSTEQAPQALRAGEVLIRVHAVSLNYRDVAMLNGKYPAETVARGVPASDCAAEVVEVGSAVEGFTPGDRVAPIFDLENMTGTETKMNALGGDSEGVLRQYAVFDQKHLYQLPSHLSWEEAATITCAGVTAWNALDLPQSAHSGKVAVLQGTGGVSIFALLICLKAGIKPIITSSSDAKLEAARKLAGPGQEILTINYKTNPKWEDEVQRLTNGKGADIVLENAGITTIAHSLASIGRRGHVSLIGFLGGFEAAQMPDTIGPLLGKSATLRGIAVGSKIQHQELSDFLAENQVSLKPLVDRVFDFDEAPAAFDYLYSGQHSGKVLIKV